MQLTQREIKEIHHALWYEKDAYGTVGHNQLLIIAKFARAVGFAVNAFNEMTIPAGIEVVEDAVRKA